MITAQTTLSLFLDGRVSWEADWIWGCPLILLTVIIHVLGLGYLSQKSILLYGGVRSQRHPTIAFALVVGAMSLLATILHAIETGIWAMAYCFIGTMPNFRNAMLYSLGAMTTYGHDNLVLEDRWRLLGTIEALSGWLLFGLSTAFLFWVIQEVSPNNRARR
ncbi:MAG TPA: ion channel [Edaphobacter sp.]|jgi:hypothetical protein|nr:ion channel [Edaphobacter sp.]